MLPGVVRTVSNRHQNMLTALFQCCRDFKNGEIISKGRFLSRVVRQSVLLRSPTAFRHISSVTSLSFPKVAEEDKSNESVPDNPEEQQQKDQNTLVRSVETAQEYLKRHNITVTGFELTSHITSVSEAGFPQVITQVLSDNRIEEPTPIQSLTWSIAFSDRHLVGISPTGSGKTLGFLVPGIMKLLENGVSKDHSSGRKPKLLVLTPTRELAMQISRVFEWFSRACRLQHVVIFGGEGKQIQTRRLREGVDVVIGTPGRCIDLMNSLFLSLDECDYVVLDEADNMLNMGFIPQVREIMKHTKAKKQMLMYSATWPEGVEDVAHEFLRNYVFLRVGPKNETANTNIKQEIIVCNNRIEVYERFKDLLRNLISQKDSKVLVFVQSKMFSDQLRRTLCRDGFNVKSIHGGLTQKIRFQLLQDFRDSRVRILVATAVASRGLDITDITHVINYDFPFSADDYVHKVGRTARYDRTGSAITFVTPEDNVSYLPSLLTNCGQTVPDDLRALISKNQDDFEYRRQQLPVRKRESPNWWEDEKRVLRPRSR